jgi:hypothetical protein
MAGTATFRRVLLDLRHAGTDRTAIRAASELARLLDIEFRGVFVEDSIVLGLSDYPFVRELRLPEHEWHKLDAERVAEEVRAASAAARRMWGELCAAVGIPSLFDIVQGDPASALGALVETSDILVRIESATASRHLAAAPLPAHGAVLIVPPRVARNHGTVATVAARAWEAAAATAAAIAAAAGERLLLLVPKGEQSFADEVVRAAGLRPEEVQLRMLGGMTLEAMLHALGNANERMLVLPRNGWLSALAAMRIAAGRKVPVLLVEAGEAAQP